MIEFVKKLYFFVFLFIKKLTKHKGGYTLFNRNNDGILCLCGFIVSFVPCAEETFYGRGSEKVRFFAECGEPDLILERRNFYE